MHSPRKKLSWTTEAFLWIAAIFSFYPLLWMLSFSLDQGSISGRSLWQIFPLRFTPRNYYDLFQSAHFGKYLFNSTVIAGGITLGNLFFCTMAGYAFSHFQFKGKHFLFLCVLSTMLIPVQALMVPLYLLVSALGGLDSYWALILPFMTSPFGVFLMKQYLSGIPKELLEAARIDGASEWTILYRIVAPLSKPILVVLGLYTFTGAWNMFIYPFLFTQTPSHYTLSVGLKFYLGHYEVDWAHLMAGSSIMALPVLILFWIFRKKILESLMQGALK